MMKYRLIEKTESDSFAQETTIVYDVASLGCNSFSVGADITVTTPEPETFTEEDVIVEDSTVTVVGHGYETGLKVQLSTDDALPTGLNTSTDYFIIVIDEDTVQFASSLANANNGVFVEITGEGPEGTTNTITATSIAGANIILQQSNDNVNWINISTAQNITVTAFFWLEILNPTGKFIRIKTTLTAGQLSGLFSVLGKGDRAS